MCFGFRVDGNKTLSNLCILGRVQQVHLVGNGSIDLHCTEHRYYIRCTEKKNRFITFHFFLLFKNESLTGACGAFDANVMETSRRVESTLQITRKDFILSDFTMMLLSSSKVSVNWGQSGVKQCDLDQSCTRSLRCHCTDCPEPIKSLNVTRCSPSPVAGHCAPPLRTDNVNCPVYFSPSRPRKLLLLFRHVRNFRSFVGTLFQTF